MIMSAVAKKTLPRKENQPNKKRKRKITKIISEEDVSKVGVSTHKNSVTALFNTTGLADVFCICAIYS